MPDPRLSEAIKEAYASAPSDIVILHTLEIAHPSFTHPIRVVNDYVKIDAKLESTASQDANQIVTFEAFAFELTLPEVADKGIPELQIRIDNVDRQIVDNVELAMTVPDLITVTYRAFLSNSLEEGPHNNPPLTLDITHIEADAFSVTARASIADFINKKFPGDIYDDVTYPGLIS